MTKNQIEFEGSDKKALEYIRMRGYCSYSSMCNVREKRDPEPFKKTEYYDFGHELHSRFLEGKKLQTLSPELEKLLKICVNKLADDPLVCKIMEGAKVEQEFDQQINGVRVYGRIDILKPNLVGDLKTTSIPGRNAFIDKMDFLQAALYLRATGVKDFYYIGISKIKPYNVTVFNASLIKDRMAEANRLLNSLLKHIKENL